MKKILAKSLLVIIEAGIDALAERIKKRREKNGNSRRLDHFPYGRGVNGVRDRSAARHYAVGGRRDVRKRRAHGRSISWERQNTKKGVRNNERTNYVPRG